MIGCIAYAAKSTEDIRGSLPTQLEDCRTAVDAAGSGRVLVASYSDEAVSGFSQSRGLGLSAAIEHVAALRAAHESSELWVQHSDRLARGDGRSARHLVEIALWALKAGVIVRSVEDPDTFRDLLYAVVTGQRNHEDSKRKGAASAAGKKRAACRGDYIGNVSDGYRVVVNVDERGHVKKTLDINPKREPLLRMIFRMALRGENSVKIAKRAAREGWLTVPRKSNLKPAPLTADYIRWTLINPRYAGLSVYAGEIVGTGHWPAYITPRQHEKLVAATRRNKPRWRPREPFLLARLARCGECGIFMITTAGPTRSDGTRYRSYICHGRRIGVCKARPIDARMVDHVFVAHLNRFLGAPEDTEPYRPSPGFPRELLRGEPDERWEQIQPMATVAAELRSRIQRALAENDEEHADELLEELVRHRVMLSEHAHRRPQIKVEQPELSEDPLTRLQDFYDWSAKDLAGELDGKPELTVPVNRCARRWFARVLLRATARGIEILPERAARASTDGGRPEPGEALSPAYANADAWTIACHLAGHGHRGKDRWLASEIIHALRKWAKQHGRAPHTQDWAYGTAEYPYFKTVLTRFGGWNVALAAAGLTPTPKRVNTYRLNGLYATPPDPSWVVLPTDGSEPGRLTAEDRRRRIGG